MSVMVARKGGVDLARDEVVSFLADNTAYADIVIQKRDNDYAGEAHASEVVTCCPMGALLKVDAFTKTMTGDPGEVSFKIGPINGLRGQVPVEFSSPSLRRCRIIIELI